MTPTIRRDGESLVLPGLASAHSHAFQRALRARTQRRSAAATNFWSWRGLMYELASKLDPESIYDISRFAYAELALGGVTAVGEFHYVHHNPDGTPYQDRVILADAVVRAALDVGIRITLLRVVYERAGAGRVAEAGQRRFCDRRLEDAFDDLAVLAKRYADDDRVRVGLAPHSVRAVSRDTIGAVAKHTEAHSLPLHMHVSEQRRELDECVAEHGLTPVALLAEDGVLSPRFVAVHATHLQAGEATALGRARAIACICRTTERDLGDGLPHLADLLHAGVRLCTGTDSHASSDPFEEARAIELDERSRVEARHAACDGRDLLTAASATGYEALGFAGGELEDRVDLAHDDPSLAAAPDELLAEAVVFGASARAVRASTVAGRPVVRGARLANYETILSRYRATLERLGLATG